MFEFRSLGEEETPRRGRPRGAVGQIRAWHHRMARLIALGLNDAQVATLVDRSAPTVRNFRLNPANAELIAKLKEEVDDVIVGEAEYRLGLTRRAGTIALEALVSRLEEGEEDFSNRELLAIADSTNDRAGIPKSAVSIGVNLGAGDRLAKARARVAELNAKPVIEGVVQGNVVKLRRF